MVTQNFNTAVACKRNIVIGKRFWKVYYASVIGVSLWFLAILLTTSPALASGAAGDLRDILENILDIIGTIFIAVGIVLAAFAIGQLALSFKNEDADSKSRASMLLVVAIVLVAFRPLVDQLGLLDYLN